MFAEVVTWNVSNTTYTADQELSPNTAFISVKLGVGTWAYDTGRKGITNHVQGTPTSNPEGAYIVVNPKVDITSFKLSTYSTQNNCNLRMYDSGNPSTIIKDFRQKGAVENDFGELKAGHTYYIYGDAFKSTGDLDYVYFKSFEATDFKHVISSTGTIGESDYSSGFASVFSPYYQLDKGKERSFSFKIHKNPYVNNETFVNPNDLDGKTLVIASSDATQLLCCTGNNQDLAVQNVQNLSDAQFYYVKFAKVTDAENESGDLISGNLYTMQLFNANGQNFSKWGNDGYVNFQPEGQNIVFALGLTQNGPYGQDVKHGGLWDITYENEKGYVIKNVARNMYFNPSNAAPSAEKVYTRFFTSKPSPYADAWNSFALMVTPTQDSEDAPYNYGINDDIQHAVLRPDNFGWGASYDGHQNNLALKDGIFNWNTFKTDLNGATVNVKASFNDNMLYVYFTMESNGRKYTYFYPTKKNITGDNVQLYFSVDHSQITDFVANDPVDVIRIATVIEDDSNKGEPHPEMGSIVITNEDGVYIPIGASLGKGTKIYLTSTANEGYLFASWSNGDQTNTREFIVGSNSDTEQHTFHAYFNDLSDFITKWTPTGLGRVYYSNGTPWTYDGGRYKSENMPDGSSYSGAYKDNGEEYASTKGLLFNSSVVLQNNSWFRLNPGTGSVKIPVVAGEIVTASAYCTRKRTVKFINSNGAEEFPSTIQNATAELVIIAASDGYVELVNTSDQVLDVNKIQKSLIYDFTFADGDNVAATPGTSGYVNELAGLPGLPFLDGATYIWTSSNPSEVRVDPYSGAIIINENFSGNVKITATRLTTGNYPALAKSYTLTALTGNALRHANETNHALVELGESGTVIFDEDAYWTNPDDPNIAGKDVKYTVLSTTAKKAVSTPDDEGFGTSEIAIEGSGTTIVLASCGAISCTFYIDTYGFVFDETSVVYSFNEAGTYQQTIPGEVSYSMEKIGAISTKEDCVINESTGEITNLPTKFEDNYGGSIVVTADNGTKTASYVLTIPYFEYTWDFYNEGQSAPITTAQYLNAENHFTYGDLVGSANPGAASEVKPEAEIPNTGSEFPNKYVIDGFGQVDAIKKLLNWQNKQDEDGVKKDLADPHNYWNYTFKTLRHVDKTYKKPIEYVNEPLFSYKSAVNGNNVRIIKETQGLIFDCAANAFGVNDNKNGSSTAIREQDRAILIFNGNSFTIPFVKENQYVKLRWYRHSDNAGDMFSVTNAKDLDGVTINPTDKLRFTGSHYERNTEYKGYTILQAASDGPMTITNTANSSWIELYTVEVSKDYSTELRVEYAPVYGGNEGAGWGGPCTSAYNVKDENENVIDVMYDMHDNLVSVVRKTGSAANTAYTEADIAVTDYPSVAERDKKDPITGEHIGIKVDNCAALTSQPVGENPIIYIGSFPGYTNGWNGWSLDVEAFPVTEDAMNLQIGLQKGLVTRIGNNITYGVHALTNFVGTGTAHVIVRTKSGSVSGSPRYTLDMQEAYFAVGEYHAQEYPYTWDFTNYNMENESVAGTDDCTYAATSASEKKSYGGWKSSDANNWRKLYTIANNEDSNPQTKGVAATIPYSLPESNARRYNKFLFADGSKLPINAGQGVFEMRESDGLRFNIGAKMNTYRDRAITLYTDGRGLELNSEEAAITIPEVDEGMYVFVKGTTPKSASNTTASDVTFEANADGDVTYYKATGGDVTLTFDGASATIYKIGVTDQVKAIKYYGYATESRAVDIDYNETRYFSAPMAMYYVTNVNGWDQRHDDFNLSDDLEVKTEASTATIKNGVYIPNGTGIIVKNDAVDYKKEQGNTFNGGKDYIVPLFVPACNVKETTGPEVTTANWLKATTSASQASAEIQPTLEDDSKQYYTLNISYVEVGREDNDIKADQVYTSIPRFYRFVGSGKGDSNTYTLVNKAYLELDKPAGVKAMDFFDINFNFDTPEEAPTSVEAADVIDNNNENGIYYNLRGQAVNGKPTVGGIYIKNGKKYYVK